MVFADSPLVAGQFVVGNSTTAPDLLAFSSSNASSNISGSTRLFNSELNSEPLPATQRSRILGNQRSNTLRGRAGIDRLYGRAGNDSLRGLSGNDKIYGQQGDDRLLGGLGNDYLDGGAGNNFLAGEAGDDQLVGGKDTDQLVGGLGNDSMNGGGGRNRLTGGAGRDRFVITGSGVAEITDFKDGEDLLQLGGGLKFEDLKIVQGAGKQAKSTLIQQKVSGKTLVILNGINSVTINDADFFGVVVPIAANPISPTPIEPNPISPTPIDPLPTNPITPPIVTPEPPPNGTTPIVPTSSIQATTIKFSASDPEATISSTGAARIKLGTQTIYVGTQQVTSINQNPIIASFDSSNPANNWVRTDYEITGADGRGYGLFWSGSQLYGVFSVDGTQGTPDQDFRRVSGTATQSWLRSYGTGGGPKVAVLAKLNPATGEMTDAVYLSAINSGKSNSFVVTGLTTNAAGNVVVSAESYFAPRRPDGQAMTQTTTAGSPFDYTLEITPNLKTVISTAAEGWS